MFKDSLQASQSVLGGVFKKIQCGIEKFRLFKSSRYIAGIDIGTSKITVAVATFSKDGHEIPEIIGIGQWRSTAVRKGDIINLSQVEGELREAFSEAEKMADATLERVYVGITGSGVKCTLQKAIQPINNSEGVVTDIDERNAKFNLQNLRFSEDKRILHFFQQEYQLDGTLLSLDSLVGKIGFTLVTSRNVVYVDSLKVNAIQGMIANMRLEPFVCFSGYASALMLMDNEESPGGLIIDLGAGTTEYVFYERGIIRDAGVLRVGGDHVSNDLAIAFNIPLGTAEVIKRQYGRAIHDPEAKGASFRHRVKGKEYVIPADNMQMVMELRLKEVFEVVKDLLEMRNLRLNSNQSVTICGGGAHIPLINELASSVFGVRYVSFRMNPIFRRLNAKSDPNESESWEKPEFATAFGLAYFGIMHTLQTH